MLYFINVIVNSSGTLLSRGLGLFKNILVNFYFGLADTFWGAFQIINTFRVFVGEGAINNVFIPNYKKLKESNQDYLKYFVLKSFLFVFLLSCLFVILLIVLSYPISKLILPGFSEDKILETSFHIMIMSSVVLMISVQSFLSAFQIAKFNNFFGFAYSPVIANIFTIVVIVLLNAVGIYSLSWAVLVGAFGMVLFQILLLIRRVEVYRLSLDIREIFRIDDYTKSFVMGFLSIIGISMITQMNSLVSRFFSSFYEGVVAASTNAYILMQVPIGIFSVAISVVGLNSLSDYFSKNKIEDFRKFASQSIRVLNLIIIPITIFMFVLSKDVVRVVYRDISGIILGGVGKYLDSALDLTHELFSVYSLSIYFLSISLLLVRISFSRGNTKIPILSSIINFAVNLVVNMFVFFVFKSYVGIPLAFLLANVISSLYLFIVEYDSISHKSIIFSEMFRLSLISLVLSFSIKFFYSFVDFSNYIISLILISSGGLIFLIVFALLGYILNIKIVHYVLDRVRNR
ncbi:MAG: hypothetical protein N2712_00115 [Brevinematales bacterium]|nr:hypothetical protein [Brevinematales bacterium]